MSKGTVTYDYSRGVMQHPSGGIILWPLDHPDTDRVSNASFALTTPVIHSDEASAKFETENTIYIPDNITGP